MMSASTADLSGPTTVLTEPRGGGKVAAMRRARGKRKTRRRFCDRDIRRVLRRILEEEFAGDATTLILDEFGCAGARADIAVVNGKLHGYEIKSEVDSLDRIDNQIRGYGLIFNNVTAVVAVKHVAKLKPKIPQWWGITAVECERGRPALRLIRKGKRNADLDADQVARLLWRDEAYAFLRRLDLHHDLYRAPATKVRQRLVEQVPLAKISAEVRRVLKLRGADPVVQPRPRSDGSYTTEPTAAVRQKNLSWLLSLR